MLYSARIPGKRLTIKAPLTVLAVGLFVTLTALGDDFVRQNSLHVHSETVLAGIDVYKDTIERAIEKLGKPSRVAVTPGPDATFSVGVYEWQTRSSSLRITAYASASKNMIVSIDVVDGHPDSGIGTTGRGLKLGDAIGDARRIYGLHPYFGTTLPDSNGIPGMFIGNDFKPHLQIDFDKVGKVNHMKLTNPCVPFCF
jgi:hypothetical protein